MLSFARLYVLLVLCAFPSLAKATAEVHLADDSLLTASSPPPAPTRVPVLFVHGHSFDLLDIGNTTDDPLNPNYKKNWWNALNSLPSFKQTIDHTNNSGLNIEQYYIRFADQARSITEDARDIEDAVDRIIQRHNPGFNTAAPTAPPPVQVIIIAYSKGTISARQYLKSLQVPVQDPAPVSGQPAAPLTAPRPNYRPVSDFIAISPPNHGIAFPGSRDTTQLSVQQLHNGVKAANLFGTGCGESYNEPRATDFITTLNGHPTTDTQNAVSDAFPSEAPGFRRDRDGDTPHTGTLYVALYATNNADAVGGDDPSGDCTGRKVARNLAGDNTGLIAINVSINNIPGVVPLTVHANTVHFQDVICKALFAAVHHRSPAAESCATVDNVPVIPLPERAAAMLALDISGSMSIPACPGCSASRLDVLKDSVELFAQLWLMMGRPNDQLGVTYFSTAVSQFQINNETLPALTPSNVNAIIADVRSKSPTNLTAMGGALQRSIESLNTLPPNPAAPPRHVILFTDGMQNVNPIVHEISANPPQHDIIDEPGRPASGVTPTNLRLDMLSGITVDTIGLGTGQAFVDLLAAISRESGGLTPAGPTGVARSTANAEDLRQFFVEQLIETLRGFSPQLVGYRRGALGKDGAAEPFAVNKSARKLLFKVSWPQGQKLEVRALKDGTDLTSSARIVSGTFYRILAFDSPAKGASGALSGDWKLRIVGARGVAYEAAAIVDEPELRFWARLGETRNQVDLPLSLTVEVRADKRPVDGPTSVTATVARPRVAIGNLLAAAAPSDAPGPGLEAAMTLAERRLALLATDVKLSKELIPRVETIPLKSDGKGRFRLVLSNVTIPGLYRAAVRIKGQDSRLGAFERSTTVTAIVRFGAADRARSEITLRPEKEEKFELMLRPRDRHGNLLGPGLAKEIKIAMSAGRIEIGPDDLGDGRYRFRLSPPEGANPSIVLTVAQRPLLKATLKDLLAQTPRPSAVSHAR